MTNMYNQTEQHRFNRELDSENFPERARQLANRCSLGKKLMNQYRIVGPIMATLGFGGAPFVYKMWEAEQTGAGTPFAIMAGLVGLLGSYFTYDSTRTVRELQRREELALDKASKLEQHI